MKLMILTYTKDNVHNFGLSLIELCKTHRKRILNGRFPGAIEGEITCVANDGSSMVDYFIASSNLFKFITDFEVGNQSEYVHFPVFCTLSFNGNGENESSVQENEFVNNYMKFKWKDTVKDILLESFNLIYNELLGSFFDKIASNVDECVQTIVKLYQTAAEYMRMKGSSKTKREPWWDKQCEKQKKEKYSALRSFRRSNDVSYFCMI